ncbi:unnamed protein product [Kluyveromyces dobzhanskii CBS 2104]|uniref:assimilatory sulfite reductase (NADPH) n=1 Tax=Kluyveromyces dobzhanskii CBS 2104 TaxID=1427455 RepID=A0A0A8L4G9_9SACH|nr:unnamed protein product [Kluyveromyces dobzhanskii CBS 2104]
MSLSYVTNPFGLPTDGTHLPTYTTPVNAINSVLFRNLKSIFSYKTFSDSDLLDASIKKLAVREDGLFFKELDVRSGAGLATLGFSKNSSAVSGIVAPGYALPYFVSGFKQESSTTSKFVFNVGSLDYDEESGALISDYLTPLKAAKDLGFPVVTPLQVSEVKATTLLTLALAKFGSGLGAVQLYDGAHYARTVTKVDDKLQDEFVDSLKLTEGSSFNQILDAFNENSPERLHNFQYFGDESAETVFVTYGSLESELFASVLEQSGSKVGVLAVRIPLPFDTEKFVSLIPATAKEIVVIGQSLTGQSPSWLRSQVSGALFFHNKRTLKIAEFIYQPNFVWSPNAVKQIATSFIPSFELKTEGKAQNFIFWTADNSHILDLASRLVQSLSFIDNIDISLRTKFDNIGNAGTFQAQFTSYPSDSKNIVSNIDSADVIVVEDISILNAYDVASTVKPEGTVILLIKSSLADKDLSDKKFYTDELKINEQFLSSVVEKNINVTLIDVETIGDKEETKGRTLSFVTQAVFWNAATDDDKQTVIRRIWNSAGPDIELLAAVLSDTISTALETGVKTIPKESYAKFGEVKADGKEKEEENEIPQLPTFVTETSFSANQRFREEVPDIEVGKIAEVSKKLTFQEAYGVSRELRPDLPVNNYVVKVKENRRVTPDDYDRYIFHIEFDISGTGMKYSIGEALGVHARNNLEQVQNFLQYYGLNENDIIQIPNRDNHHFLESRTVLQAFTENLDIFGKPPKRFYESLIEFCTDDSDKSKLENLVSPAGATELKRYQDVEYYSYSDIFELFPSARPGAEDLAKIIAPLKRREYSIASSQRVHPNEVHLLIVVVDWIDNKGRKRYGQASKFISDLAVGSELVVSVKPSVMKLPPSPKQPVIMSGLGTGLAPFKAIVEEKLWQKQQGYEIGEVFLYMGSRHKREEYLYGELWEAYKDAGIITHIGAAFSRDQPEKIYIQDRIRENLPDLKTAMIQNEGSFYLCGPTWPVPDITQALQDIISADAKERGVKVDLDAAVEELKEASRYILEVY